MKTIGIIGAMEEEVVFVKGLIEIITAKNMLGLDFYVGKFEGNQIIIVRSGIGKVNAAVCAQVLIDHFAVDYIINVGVAGGLYPGLRVGDIVISTDAVQHDMDASAFGDPVGVIPRMAESCFKADAGLAALAKNAEVFLEGTHSVFEGRVASGDQFIADPDVKNRIWTLFKAYCVEMEGAAIAHACYLNKIPFVIIRSISDNADGSAGISFEQFTQIAVKNSSTILEHMLRQIQ